MFKILKTAEDVKPNPSGGIARHKRVRADALQGRKGKFDISLYD
jgi:hypothetical protein